MDTISNIIYALGQQPILSRVTAQYARQHPNRPEVCCMIANMFSQRLKRNKAIKFFRRAVALDRTCHNAWTCLGHEYMAMQNYHAAIESYRNSVGEIFSLERKTLLNGNS